MSSLNILCLIAIVLLLWYEWQIVAASLRCLSDAIICLLLATAIVILGVCCLALSVIVPVFMLLGVDSRCWCQDMIKWASSLGRKK